mgnify:CR=1 FL=1
MALNTGIAQTSVDFKGLAELRRSATVDKKDQETIKQVAAQFESLFTGMMLKSMRQASLAKGILDSSQSDMYRDMSDQQLAMDLSTKGGLGLQSAIIRQLGGQPENQPKSYSADSAGNIDTIKFRPALLQQVMSEAPIQSASQVSEPNELSFDSPKSFVQQLLPIAQKAADKLGVSADVILAQAALETGWGKHIINRADGQSSNNLFNIKADKSWQGEAAATGTIEYRDGIAVREQAKFRSYESYQDSFNDYVDFLQTQPRYQDALKQTDTPEAFIEGLHKAGYATDPAYADKVKKIMNSSTVAQFSQQMKHS